MFFGQELQVEIQQCDAQCDAQCGAQCGAQCCQCDQDGAQYGDEDASDYSGCYQEGEGSDSDCTQPLYESDFD